MNPHTFHQWITRKYGFFTQHCRKYPTLVHLRFPYRKISLAQYLLIKHEHITIFPQLRARVYSFNHQFYLKFNLFFPQYHHHPAIQILPFLAGVNTKFTPTKARKYPSDVGARPDFMFARIIGKTRIADHHLYSSSTSLRLPDRYAYHQIAVEKDRYHREDRHHSYDRHVQPGHEIVQLFHRFYRLQSIGFLAGPPGPFAGGGYQLAIGSWQLARREEMWKRRNEETEKRRIKAEGLPKRLEPGSIYRSMIMSKNISHVVDPGKEAFYMARMGLFRVLTPGGGPRMQLLPFSGRTRGSPLRSPRAWYSGNKTGEGRGEPCVRPYPEFRWFLLFPDSFPGAAPWGQEQNIHHSFVSSLQYSTTSFLRRLLESGDVEVDVFTKKANDTNTAGILFKKSLSGEEGISKNNRFTPSLDYFTPHRVSVGDRDQSLIEVGKPGFPAMDVKDKITSENIFGNYASPGISQQQGSNIDIDQLTDRVYRVLEDKIRTEKEMRGW